jgi:biotin operon repressor
MNLFPDYEKYAEFDNKNNKSMSIEPQHILVAGAGLEVMREIREKIERIELKLNDIERKIHEHIPEKVLTENKFIQEVQLSDNIVERIVSEIRNLSNDIKPATPQEYKNSHDEDGLTIVEKKKIEKITSLLQNNGKLSSLQLAHLLDMSRTRANEYFKHMENMGIVEGVLIGKEKFYQLTDSRSN